jgi:putative ABC transport system permease protein
MPHPFAPDGSPTRVPTWRRYLGFWGARVDADVDEEIAFHVEMRVQDYIARGMSEREARAAAVERLGGSLESARDECVTIGHRRQRRLTRQQTMETLIQDLRFALRTLGRQKGWTAVAILTLALGIGANTAVFSVVNDLLLDPLRYPNADRLVLIMRANTKSGIQLTPSRKLRDAWKQSARSLVDIQGITAEDVTEASGSEPHVLREARVFPSFFAFAGVRPIAGRLFREEEASAAAAPVVVLSEKSARERFGDAPSAVGKTMKIDTTVYTVVGVVRDGIRLPAFSPTLVDLYVPITPDVAFFSGPAVARLKPGVTIEAAQTELRTIADNIAKSEGTPSNSSYVISVRPPGSIGDTRDSIILLAASVALLLLIACANVAHLLLARAAAREREISVRTALGAGRGRIIRQLLTESMLLAAGGCAVGLIVGSLGLRLIIALRPANLGELSNAHIDGRVLAATLIVSALTGIGFGLTAAIHSLRSSSFTILRSSIGGTASRNRHRIRSLLVVTEMSLSVVLLVGATLLIRTVINLHRIDPGFDTTNLYALPFSLPPTRYRDTTAREAFARDLLAKAKRLPGYEAVTVADNVPTRTGIIVGNWEAEGDTAAASADRGGLTTMNSVLPDYFGLMKMRFVAGRAFDESSVDRREVIVSASLAHQLWPNSNAIGKRLRMSSVRQGGTPEPWSVVRGVVADASLMSLHDARNTPAIYYPSKTGLGWSGATLIVRTAAGHSPYADMRKLSRALDPNLAPPTTLRVTDLLNDTVASQRFMMALLTTFALLAVCLSAIGLYGVIAYMVSQSTREIGVRIALGASRMDIVRLVMVHGAGLAATGLVIGLAGATWGVSLLKKTLYGVQPMDPVSFALGALALLSVAVLACLVPTRRAVRVDPVIAMRAE